MASKKGMKKTDYQFKVGFIGGLVCLKAALVIVACIGRGLICGVFTLNAGCGQ